MSLTKEEVISKANSIIDLAMVEARKAVEKAVNSGGIELNDMNVFLLGQIVAKAAINEGASKLIILSKKDEKTVKNLSVLI